MIESAIAMVHGVEAVVAPHGEWLAIAGLALAIAMLRRGSRARTQTLD